MSDKPRFVKELGTAEVGPPAIDAWTNCWFPPLVSEMYSRAPSVSTETFGMPSCVIWVVARTLGGGTGERSQAKMPATAPSAITTAASQGQRDLLIMAGALAAVTFPEVVSRFRRLRSARNSAA